MLSRGPRRERLVSRHPGALEHLTGDVALEAADDFALGAALGRPPCDVSARRFVMTHPDQGHDVEGAVRCPITTAAEAVPPRRAAAAGRLGSDAAELGEGGFVADATRVLAGSDEKLPGEL